MRELHLPLHAVGRAFSDALGLPTSIFAGWFYGGALPLRRAAVKSNRGLVALDSKELTGLTLACAIAKAGGKGRRVGKAFVLVRDGLTGLRPGERSFLVADLDSGWLGVFVTVEAGVPRPEESSHRVIPLSALEEVWRAALESAPPDARPAEVIARVLSGVRLDLEPPPVAEAAVEPVEGADKGLVV